MRVNSLMLASVSVFLPFAALPCLGQPEGVALTPPVVIDASVVPLDKAHAVKRVEGRTFFVVGKPAGGSEDSAVGYTRTGKKTVSPILCDPGPAEALRLTVAGALEAQGLLAESAEAASFVIDLTPDLRLAEENRKLHQAIVATLKVEAAVWDAGDPGRVKKFKMEASGERKTFDTTKQAAAAAREAVRAAAGEILKSLDSL